VSEGGREGRGTEGGRGEGEGGRGVSERGRGGGVTGDSAEGEAGQPDGMGIVTADWAGTAAFGATSALGAFVPQLDIVALVVALALFGAGTVGFFVAFVRAVGRSRAEEIGVMNLFFLDHSAPSPVRRSMLAALAVQIVTAAATAAARPNTSLAFGILAPVYGLALQGVWASRHGTFPPRQPKPHR
jgi:hypothetical protein